MQRARFTARNKLRHGRIRKKSCSSAGKQYSLNAAIVFTKRLPAVLGIPCPFWDFGVSIA